MDHYWENAGVPQPPPVPTATQGTYPTDGNLPAAVAPSTPGAWWYHQITEEIRNAIIRLGGTPDFTQVNQLGNALVASIASAVSSVTQQLAKVATSGSYNDLSNKPAIQAPLGFTPVQQGGGVNQGGNKVYVGWRTSGGVAVTVDRTDQGNVVFEGELQANVANLQNNINATNGAVQSLSNQVQNIANAPTLAPNGIAAMSYSTTGVYVDPSTGNNVVDCFITIVFANGESRMIATNSQQQGQWYRPHNYTSFNF
ncbi:hypothetical protein [Burkholderia sp. BCC0405]|uniref:hypothetical protein n=1 Tax=Burkholderia sp. BCC0405 TaxID=2676298 RepID=UPI00158C03CC|nr:hypothetical protein [Burkholderia sp. BCC0405]